MFAISALVVRYVCFICELKDTLSYRFLKGNQVERSLFCSSCFGRFCLIDLQWGLQDCGVWMWKRHSAEYCKVSGAFLH